MGVNKLIVGSETKFDISKDTVTADKLLKGFTAHDGDGEAVTGTCTFDADTSDATVTAAKLLEDETAYAAGSKVTGTMPNKGSVTLTMINKSTPVKIPYGFHDGSGEVSLSDEDIAEIIPQNIRQGIDFLGVTGTMSGTEDVHAQAVEVTPTLNQQVITPDSTQGYNYLSKVTVKKIPVTETPTPGGGTTITVG